MNQQASRNLRKAAKEETITEQPVVIWSHEGRTPVGNEFPIVKVVTTYPERRANYQSKKRMYSELNHIQKGAYNTS